MSLALDIIGTSDERTFVFAHGILGSRNNWRGFARRLIERVPTARAILVDLRNHGESHGFSPPHTIEACAKDVAEIVAGRKNVTLVGHSFGGKVMLELARTSEPDEVWSLDSPPGKRSTGEEIERVIQAVREVELPLKTRQSLLPILQGKGLSEKLAQWMTTNLRAGENGLVWKFDLAAIPEMLESFGETDLWPYIDAPKKTRVVIVRGGKSDRWSPEELARLKQSAVEEHVMAQAGHWLHTDDPEKLLEIMIAG